MTQTLPAVSVATRARDALRWTLAVGILGTITSFAAPGPQPPAQWKLELIAQAPVVQHPSIVCTAPDGRVFVAEDPMDITAPGDAQLGKILCLHPDGGWTVFATELHAVFGMQYLEGKLYVLHNPKFTVFEDDHGVGSHRVDLIEQTNPNPWALDWNDHIPAGFHLAMDGYFYVAVGDKGLYHCKGRDGSEVNLHGGGVLRMRPDATELEIFCRGVRNILDVAISPEDELFTYDNTDEHQWMGRLTHMVDGGFYGYPYDFIPRRPYTLWMMHDFGAGAACSAVCYNEDALPPEYRGNLFLSDFGKRQIIRVRVDHEGATFLVSSHEELFHDPPEDFRPVGICFSADGLSIYICDWQHRDVKEKDAQVGRLWKMTWLGTNHAARKPDWYVPLASGTETKTETLKLIIGLSHPSQAVRLSAQREVVKRARKDPAIGRMLRKLLGNAAANPLARAHALWAIDQVEVGKITPVEILGAARDSNAMLARQAIRELGTRRSSAAVPVLLAQMTNRDASIRFQATIALGRMGSTNAIAPLLSHLSEDDLFARFAVFKALNRIGSAHPSAWSAIVGGFESREPRVREGTQFALRETFSPDLLEALLPVASDQKRTLETREAAARSLAGLHHKPPEWHGEWWAYHPAKAPPPARNLAWEKTEQILGAFRTLASNPQPGLRLIAVEVLGEAADLEASAILRERLGNDPDLRVRKAALSSLASVKDVATRPLVIGLLKTATPDSELVADAIRLSPEFGGEEITRALADLLGTTAALSQSLRLAVIDALTRLGGSQAARAIRGVLLEGGQDDLRPAIKALGKLRDREALPDLIKAAQSQPLRPEVISALCRMSDARALNLYLEGLGSLDASLREECRKALSPIRQGVFSQIETKAASMPPLALAELRKVYAEEPELLKKLQSRESASAPDVSEYEQYALNRSGDTKRGEAIFLNEQGVACIRCHAVGGRGGAVGPDLTLAGAQFSRAQLIESVLYPSRAVREGYQQIIVKTKDDEAVSGALKADTADGLTLVDASGRTNFVARPTILDRQTSPLSLMPEGLQAGLTLEEFADLIAYLESLRARSLPTGQTIPSSPSK